MYLAKTLRRTETLSDHKVHKEFLVSFVLFVVKIPLCAWNFA
jgi:hypothetical protein